MYLNDDHAASIKLDLFRAIFIKGDVSAHVAAVQANEAFDSMCREKPEPKGKKRR